MLKESIQVLKWKLFHGWLSVLVWRIRRKERIRFGFLLQELSQWKTESLYKAMLAHPRFDPVLCISPSLELPGAENRLIEYVREKGYDYEPLEPGKKIREQVRIDFALPEKPYPAQMHMMHRVDRNPDIPFVIIPYFLGTITENWVVNQRSSFLCWKEFVDNESCRQAWAKVHRLKGFNYAVTGLPVMDELLTPREELPDVWPETGGRKRIIYAPHHTISDIHLEGIGYSTFLDYCEAMLELRDQYRDQVYFVFKPHPSLRRKLLTLWGEERTDAYYQRWEKPGVSHVEQGAYLSLFKHSDALIHDCGSFTLEYMYMDRPVMYLVRDESHTDNMIPHARKAFDLHYKGRNLPDIERFIQDVLKGFDPLKEERADFKRQHLLPPNGRTACENIMHTLLGDE